MKLKIQLIIILLLGCSLIVSFTKRTKRAKKFHHRLLRSSRTHTDCNISKQKINDKDKMLIVDVHNKFRNEIATQTNQIGPKLPFAINMMQVYWNENLALKAQQWADKCMYWRHSSLASRSDKMLIGENIYAYTTSGGTPKMEWAQVIQRWFGQLKNFKGKTIYDFRYGGGHTNFFTQLIWAETNMIGCGFSQFKTPKGLANEYVCYYSPRGNNWRKSIYTPSKKQECKCPDKTSCKNKKYKGLCCMDGNCEENSFKITT